MSALLYLLGEDGVVSLSTHTLPLPGLGIIQLITTNIIIIPDYLAAARPVRLKFNNAVVMIIKIQIIEVTMIIKIKIIKTMLPAAHSRRWPGARSKS